MKPPLTEEATAKDLHAVQQKRPVAHASAAETVPLDDFLKVEVLHRASIRSAVRTFLSEHCARRRGLLLISGRGKLIAELCAHSGLRMNFGELISHASHALAKSELREIREMDSRELARALCIPPVDAH